MGSIQSCLAGNIRRLRKEQNLTQSELAEKAGISLIFLQGIETEKKWISPQTVSSLAQALNVSQSKLFENCLPDGSRVKVKRIGRASLDHIPDDIFNALATTCKHPSWKWEFFRWIIDGHSRDLR